MYIFSRLHTHTHTHARTHARTHTHLLLYQGNETEEKVFEKRKVFKEGLKEPTEAERRAETGSWFQTTGAWY